MFDSSEVSDLLVFKLQLTLYLLTELLTSFESLCCLQLSLAVNFSLFRQQLHLHKDTHIHMLQLLMTTLDVGGFAMGRVDFNMKIKAAVITVLHCLNLVFIKFKLSTVVVSVFFCSPSATGHE